MKKNNSYITDDEIDLGDLIRTLWRKKILILLISIICGLLAYLYASFKPKEFKTEIILKNPPPQIFEPYGNVSEQFISNFKLNILSLDNLESFVEESRDLDNFKAYIKSNNITVKKYFKSKFGQVTENKYFLVFSTKELDGGIFLTKYVEFIKKKTVVELKNSLKLTFLNTINNYQQALEIAKKIQLENLIISTTGQSQKVNDPELLFYKGTKVLSQNLDDLNKTLIKLENDQFNYNQILDKGIIIPNDNMSSYFYFLIGLFIGFFLSCIIIFFKATFRNN